MTEECSLPIIENPRTSPYHPQGNGQVERHNRVLADVIIKHCSENLNEWESILPYVEFVYNTTTHKSTGESPFSLLFGDEAFYRIDCSPNHQTQNLQYTSKLIFWREISGSPHLCSWDPRRSTTQTEKQVFQENVRKIVSERQQGVALFASIDNVKNFYFPWTGRYTVVRKMDEFNCDICSEMNKKKNETVHYNRLKPLKAQSEKDDQPLRQFTRIAERLITQRYDADHFPEGRLSYCHDSA